MTYVHSANHSFKPEIQFWRSLENLFDTFPYWKEWNKYRSKQFLITFFEIETKELFDVKDDIFQTN